MFCGAHSSSSVTILLLDATAIIAGVVAVWLTG